MTSRHQAFQSRVAGNASAPSFGFQGTSSGIFREGNNISFSINATRNLSVSENGILFDSVTAPTIISAGRISIYKDATANRLFFMGNPSSGAASWDINVFYSNEGGTLYPNTPNPLIDVVGNFNTAGAFSPNWRLSVAAGGIDIIVSVVGTAARTVVWKGHVEAVIGATV
jgi:hypothetical protein